MTTRDATARWTLADRPVTVADYRAFCKATGREWAGPSPDWQDDWPANLTTWHDATDYCEWRTAQGYPCRLPTEAEWVAGTPSGWTVGDENERNGRAVWEWTADLWDDERPDGPRVLRGGSWLGGRLFARAAVRLNFPPLGRSRGYGFRVVVARPAPGPLASGDSAPATRDPLAGAREWIYAVVDRCDSHLTSRDSDALADLASLALAGLALRENSLEVRAGYYLYAVERAALARYDATVAAAMAGEVPDA